jgi:low temperature requirement protein LtrA
MTNATRIPVERSYKVLTGADEGRRTNMIMYGYFYAHLPIVIGVITLAAGLKKAISHPAEPLHTAAAIALAGGVTIYLLGDVWFRHIMRLGPSRQRTAAALAALATIPVGLWKAEPELVTLVLIIIVALLTEAPVMARVEAAADPESSPCAERSGSG